MRHLIFLEVQADLNLLLRNQFVFPYISFDTHRSCRVRNDISVILRVIRKTSAGIWAVDDFDCDRFANVIESLRVVRTDPKIEGITAGNEPRPLDIKIDPLGAWCPADKWFIFRLGLHDGDGIFVKKIDGNVDWSSSRF